MKILLFVLSICVMCVQYVSAQEGEQSAWTLEPLPYAYDALEPYIDAQTMEIHYSRHHRAYFDKFVEEISKVGASEKALDTIITHISDWPVSVRNNGGGHYNHSLFWSIMGPDGGGSPYGALAEEINIVFGSFAAFKDAFKDAAMSRFGSGWAWLCVDTDGTLFITSTPNQDNPLMNCAEKRGIPILGLDVWEHAYYLKYQNRRVNYVDSFWNVVNWNAVSARFDAAVAQTR